MKYRNIITLPLLVIITFCFIKAEDYGSIGTSRPGAANPTSSVPTGLYQFEMGTNLETSPGMDTTFTIPTLLRMGVYNNIELQVAFASKYLTLGILYGGMSFLNGLENSIILTTSLTENNDSLTEYNAYLPLAYSFQNGYSIFPTNNLSKLDQAYKKSKYILSYSKDIKDCISLAYPSEKKR